MHDALSVYDGPDYRTAAHALCGAHLIRELTAIAEQHPHAIWPLQARAALAELAGAARTARDHGLTEIPPEQSTEALMHYRHAVLVGLAQHPRAEGRKQSKARNLLELKRPRFSAALIRVAALG